MCQGKARLLSKYSPTREAPLRMDLRTKCLRKDLPRFLVVHHLLARLASQLANLVRVRVTDLWGQARRPNQGQGMR